MKKLSLIVAAAAFALSFGASAFAEGHGGDKSERHAKHMAHMKAADTNGDKRISKSEFLTAAEKKFSKKDTNGDGYLDKSDRKGGKGKGNHFDRIDTNGDGNVSKAEFEAAKAKRGEHKQRD